MAENRLRKRVDAQRSRRCTAGATVRETLHDSAQPIIGSNRRRHGFPVPASSNSPVSLYLWLPHPSSSALQLKPAIELSESPRPSLEPHSYTALPHIQVGASQATTAAWPASPITEADLSVTACPFLFHTSQGKRLKYGWSRNSGF